MKKMENNVYGTCKIDSKNRITLSPKTMKFLKLTPGDYVSIEECDSTLCLYKAYICVKRNNTD